MTTKLAAVVAVVVVVAGCAVGLTMTSTSDNNDDVKALASLNIRGNADENYVIDQKDMDIVLKVKDDKSLLEQYPFADVDADGDVTDKDVKILQDMLDRKEGTTVYVESLDRLGNVVTVPVVYPLRNIVSYGTNMDMPMLYAGGGEYVAGYFVSSYTAAQRSISDSAVDLKGAQKKISDAAWANFTKLDSDLQPNGGIGAFLADYSGISQITEQRAEDLKDAGIPMICYKSADSVVESSTILTLSYLFGSETEAFGIQYAKLMDSVLSKIDSAVGSLADSDKKTYMCFTMYIYICGLESTFNTTPVTAGGIPYGEYNKEFGEKYVTGSTKMDSVEALANYTDVDCLINTRSIDWQKDQDHVDYMITSTWNHNNAAGQSSEYFKGFEDRLVYINNVLPGVAKLAYVAASLYGEKFSYTWADETLQSCIDMGLIPLQDYTVAQMLPYFDYEMYKAASEKN